MKKSAIITQSNYIPWKGYIDSIAAVDTWVVYDEVQFTKRDWRNRNKIKTQNGTKWLTIPVEVKGKFFQKIKDTKIADSQWAKNHWNVIFQNYKKAACFPEVRDFLEPLYLECSETFLTDVNLRFIRGIMDFLNIQTEILSSSNFNLAEGKTERLVEICAEIEAQTYYSGPAAKNYIDQSKFESKQISVNYWDYSGYPEYDQLYPPFEHAVSVVDLLFSHGSNSRDKFKFALKS